MENLDEPKFKTDILEQLLHQDGVPAVLRRMEEYVLGLGQHCSRAADEIEKLRKQNKHLKKLLRRNNISVNQWIIVCSKLNKKEQDMYVAKNQMGYTCKLKNACIFDTKDDALEDIKENSESTTDKDLPYGKEKPFRLKKE